MKKYLYSTIILLIACGTCWGIYQTSTIGNRSGVAGGGPTEVIRYVDPDATGAGNGTSWTDAYTSLSAWESNEQTNLESANQWMHVYCRASSSSADTTAVTIDGWTTTATNYILIDGDWDTGTWSAAYYHMDVDGIVITIQEEHVHLKQLQINIGSSYDTNVKIQVSGSSGVKIERCLFRADASGTGQTGLHVADGSASGGTIKVWNTIIHGYSGSNSQGIVLNETNITMYLQNSIVYNCGTNGIRETAGTLNTTNSVSFTNNDDFVVTNGTITYCASDDGDGANSVQPSVWENVFVTVGSNFHLEASDTDLTDTGTDLSGGDIGFSDDIDGDTRTGTWDIGVDHAT